MNRARSASRRGPGVTPVRSQSATTPQGDKRHKYAAVGASARSASSNPLLTQSAPLWRGAFLFAPVLVHHPAVPLALHTGLASSDGIGRARQRPDLVVGQSRVGGLAQLVCEAADAEPRNASRALSTSWGGSHGGRQDLPAWRTQGRPSPDGASLATLGRQLRGRHHIAIDAGEQPAMQQQQQVQPGDDKKE